MLLLNLIGKITIFLNRNYMVIFSLLSFLSMHTNHVALDFVSDCRSPHPSVSFELIFVPTSLLHNFLGRVIFALIPGIRLVVWNYVERYVSKSNWNAFELHFALILWLWKPDLKINYWESYSLSIDENLVFI